MFLGTASTSAMQVKTTGKQIVKTYCARAFGPKIVFCIPWAWLYARERKGTGNRVVEARNEVDHQ